MCDTSEGKDPLEIGCGYEKLIRSFDKTVIGNGKGEEKQVKI